MPDRASAVTPPMPATHRLQVRTARDEGDVVPRRGQPGSVISADPTGPDRGDSHVRSLPDGGRTPGW